MDSVPLNCQRQGMITNPMGYGGNCQWQRKLPTLLDHSSGEKKLVCRELRSRKRRSLDPASHRSRNNNLENNREFVFFLPPS